MTIEQFEYEPLSQFSYTLVSKGEMAVIDPQRDPMEFYKFAKEHNAKIVAIIETHPHADFVSAHLQMHKETGATIYCSEKTGAEYPHSTFDDGDSINVGDVTLSAINTPGHSPDSITIVAKDGNKTAMFTGDTLLIGDVGRPDLREKSGNVKAKRKELAEMMYYTVQNKFNDIPDDATVYPAHGAGSLCGSSMGDGTTSTLGNEREENWAFQKQSKEDFISHLLDNQPFIPSYFGYNVEVNKVGASSLTSALGKIPFYLHNSANGLIVDIREESEFKTNHINGSINIQASSDKAKFETWLGSIVKPKEKFTLVIDKPGNLEKLLNRVAKIGYEDQLKKVITLDIDQHAQMEPLDLTHFKNNQDGYTIVDIRNQSEINDEKYFDKALEHPLNELRETAKNIKTNKPIVVHCAGGYRSAAGSSILKRELKGATIYDLSDDIEKFK